MPPSDKPRRDVSEQSPSAENPVRPEQVVRMMMMKSAREVAFRALLIIHERQRRAADVLAGLLYLSSLSEVDRGLARELTFGVVRREMPLNRMLEHLLKRPLNEIEPPLVTILQLGLYQIVYADQIPAHAAVHETVELAKDAGRLRWGGFVNGVLRGATRLCREEFTTGASSRAVPVSGGRFRLLNESVFPDPGQDRASYFSWAFNYPSWVAERWAARWDLETLQQIGDWQRSAPPIFVRVNLLKTTRDELQQQFSERGLIVTPGSLPESLQVISGGKVEDWPGYAQGLFSVQDLSAMHAARRLKPAPGEKILDLCAAPGGKSCHLAELMQNQGDVIAVDVEPYRLSKIVENSRRLELPPVQAVLVNSDGRDLPRGPFDAVLADVPCSNTGVLGRRPEVLWNLTPESIAELTVIQARLLRQGADRLKPGGRLLYSTCSIETEENQQIVESFLRERSEFTLQEAELLLPGAPADGGYQALLVRK